MYLIQILVENNFSPPENDYEKCIKEAILCHHNEIALYLIDNFSEKFDYDFKIEPIFFNNRCSCIFQYFNFYFFDEYLQNRISFCYLCKFGYYHLVDLYLKYGNIDINATFVENRILFINFI